ARASQDCRLHSGARQPSRPRGRGGSPSERSAVKEYPYWWDTQNPEPGTPEPLPLRADVAIVGAGYTGLAAARHLARAGASVVVFERERVGFGASSRNGGQVIAGMKLDASTLVDRYGEARARELFDISLDAMTAVETLIAAE